MFFIISVGAQGMIPSSTLVIPLDLSPNYAGSIAALTNGIASTTGFLVPFVIGLLTPNVNISNKKFSQKNYSTFAPFYPLCSHCHPNGESYSGSHSACIIWKSPTSYALDQLACNRGIRRRKLSMQKQPMQRRQRQQLLWPHPLACQTVREMKTQPQQSKIEHRSGNFVVLTHWKKCCFLH